MAVPVAIRSEMRRILLQGEPWAQILSPEPARPVTIPKPEPRLLTELHRSILRAIDPLEEVLSRGLAPRLGMETDRLSGELTDLVQRGYLYREWVLEDGRRMGLYGITDEGLEAATRPTLEESKVRPLKEIVITNSPNLTYDRPKPEPQVPYNPDDWLNTGARWVRKDELAQLSSPCRVVRTARTAEVDEPPKPEPKPRPGSTKRAHKDPAADPRQAEVIRMHHANCSQYEIQQTLHIGRARLQAILKLAGLAIRPSCVHAKRVAPSE